MTHQRLMEKAEKMAAQLHYHGTDEFSDDASTVIRELLAELDAARKDAEAAWASLPGVIYMDPPDGGSPTLAEMLGRMAKDAERWRYLVAENNKGGMRGKYCICWYDPKGDGYITTSGLSCDGKDDQAIVRIIDAALNADREKDSD